MPYAPTVNDESGQILAGYQTRSAEIKAAGNEALAQGIMRGATSAIGGGLGAATGFNTAGMITDAKGNSIPGLGEALNDVKANAIKYDTAAGMLDTYKQNAEALGLDMQMLQGIEQKYANKPNELIGALTVVGKIGENNLDIQKAEKTYAALGNVYAGRASATAAAKAAQPPKMNAENIRSMVSEAKTAGFTDEQIKSKLQSQYGDWAVNSVYPSKNQGIWMGQ
jgi:hypothetical protein